MQTVKVAAAMAERNVGVLLVALVVLAAALLVLSLVLLARVRRMSRGYARLMAGTTGEGLENALNEHVDRVVAALARADEVAAACQDLDRRVVRCVQRVGIVRFDAFGDVGGELSFALALLDDADDGVVVSSLHSRLETRLYAKPIRGGQSEVTLSTEEAEALQRAGIETGPSRVVARVGDPGRSARR